jgi:hypothetical protein
MREFSMQNIIKLGLLAVLCVSTSVWAREDQHRENSDKFELPGPAVPLANLTNRLDQSNQTPLLVNDLSDHKLSGDIKLLENPLQIAHHTVQVIQFSNLEEVAEHVLQIANTGQQKEFVFTFDNQKYRISTDGTNYNINLWN